LFCFFALLCSLHSLLWKSKRKSDQAWKRWNPRRFLKLLVLKNRRTLKMFAPDLRVWREMFAASEKCSRPTFAPEEKCLRPLKNVRAQPLRLKRNVCGLWKNGAKKEKIRNQI
jgi:hypothetical protein